jgi:hypothetical protein
MERTIWTFEATLSEYKEEKGSTGDNDYHLALCDGARQNTDRGDSKSELSSEYTSTFRDMIKQARADVNSKLTVTGGFKFIQQKGTDYRTRDV